jgi:AraC family transcriptional regulator of adaptative response / DNA-3-methyladenine glycosylase II
MKLIADGAVDREGVSGLACRLGYSERQLHRLLTAELGTGALSLARAQRAQTARVLLQTTDVSITEVAFAAGFSSLRQFNETIRAIFARTPSELRTRGARRRPEDGRVQETDAATISVRLTYRRPLATARLFGFLGMRAIPGIEAFDGEVYRRSLRLPHGLGTVALRPIESAGEIRADFALTDIRDLTAAIARCRHLLNLDADPIAVDGVLGADELLASSVAATPGLRVPGAADGFELAVRAIIGQQVSVMGARTVAAAIVRRCGEPLPAALPPLTHAFPTAEALARAARDDPAAFPMPGSRRQTLARLAQAVAAGELVIDPGADRDELAEQLQALTGIGPWTAGYIGMRALSDPDAFIAGDLGVLRALAALGAPHDARSAAALAERWRPWRAYAVAHLWNVPIDRSPRRAQPAAPGELGHTRGGGTHWIAPRVGSLASG